MIEQAESSKQDRSRQQELVNKPSPPTHIQHATHNTTQLTYNTTHTSTHHTTHHNTTPNNNNHQIDKIFTAAEQAASALEEAAPLLEEATQLAREITPLLQELRQGGLVGNLEHLTEAAASAAADLQALQTAVLTDENVRALRGSVQTLCRTLEHAESISADVGAFSRDAGVQRNLKTLIQALSRIIEE